MDYPRRNKDRPAGRAKHGKGDWLAHRFWSMSGKFYFCIDIIAKELSTFEDHALTRIREAL
jgi:hypothetical protein